MKYNEPPTKPSGVIMQREIPFSFVERGAECTTLLLDEGIYFWHFIRIFLTYP